MNKEIDWHGPRYSYTRTMPITLGPEKAAPYSRVWLGDRLIVDAAGDGAWPKPIYPEPPCGWDERDALA